MLRRLYEILASVLGREPDPNRKMSEYGLSDEDMRFLAQSAYRELGWEVPPHLLKDMTPKEMEKELLL